MTELLLRVFVKDHLNTESFAVRSSIGKMAGASGLVCNGLLFVLKLMAGILAGSVSVVADALNNLSDAASSAVTLLGFRLAQRPADEEHPYGHARYEYVAGLIVSFLVLLIGVELGKSSVEKILRPAATEISAVTLTVLGIAVLLKLWMCFFYKNLGDRINAAALHAASIDSRNDVITTAVVLTGCLIQMRFGINIDGYMGLAVALFILVSGVNLVRETLSPLLGKKADEILVERIKEKILSHEMILGIHDLLIHDYGPGQCFASVHAELDAEVEPLSCHELIDHIEREVQKELGVQLVIHHDPVTLNDTEWSLMRQTVEEIVREIDPQLAIHDLRIVRGSRKPRLLFDLEVPYAMREQSEALKNEIDRALKDRGLRYKTAICFDDK